MKIEEDGTWIVKNKSDYDHYNKRANPVKRRFFVKKEMGRILGESTAGATIEIINHYKPKIWVIENPKTSKIWDFQRKHWNFPGVENATYYSAYDSKFSTKPTIFKSNKKIPLINIKPKFSNAKHMSIGNYSKRSSIPSNLIKQILEYCLIQLERRRT